MKKAVIINRYSQEIFEKLVRFSEIESLITDVEILPENIFKFRVKKDDKKRVLSVFRKVLKSTVDSILENEGVSSNPYHIQKVVLISGSDGVQSTVSISFESFEDLESYDKDFKRESLKVFKGYNSKFEGIIYISTVETSQVLINTQEGTTLNPDIQAVLQVNYEK